MTMPFPLHDLEVALPASFVEELQQALQAPAPGFVLLYAGSHHHRLYAAREYLRKLAVEYRAAAGRTVHRIQGVDTMEDLASAIAACEPGSLVFLDELRPNSSCVTDSVAAAARFAMRGATVVATIHGTGDEQAKSRLLDLWRAEGRCQTPAEETLTAATRFIGFRGVVQTLPA